MWLAVSLALITTIVLLSLLPGTAWIVRTTPSSLQKLLHVLFYAALTASLLVALSSVDLDQRITVALIGIGTIGLGAALEWLQRFRPGRTSRAADVARDASGVALGIAIWAGMHP